MVTASESCSSTELSKSHLKRIYEGLYDVALKKVTEGRDGRTWSYNVDNIPPQPLIDRAGEVVPDQFVVSVHLWYGLALWSDVKKNEWLLEVPYGVPVAMDANGASTFTIESRKFVGTKGTGWVRKS